MEDQPHTHAHVLYGFYSRAVERRDNAREMQAEAKGHFAILGAFRNNDPSPTLRRAERARIEVSLEAQDYAIRYLQEMTAEGVILMQTQTGRSYDDGSVPAKQKIYAENQWQAEPEPYRTTGS